ncbi:MAG: hypothetical protein ABI615_07670 [Chthoniobacterales bacterium]
MEIVFIIAALVVLFIAWTIFTTLKKIRTTNEIAESLNPEAKEQYYLWDTESNKASTLGKHYEARVFQAKALIVSATNCAISDTVRGSVPFVCQPGYVEGLSAGDLDILIDDLQQARAPERG